MRVTNKQIEVLIESAKVQGASAKRIAALEKMLSKRNSLKNVKNPSANDYVIEQADDQGNTIVYYSTVPLSEKSKDYLDKL